MTEPTPADAYTVAAIKHVSFVVLGEPIPKARARVTAHGTYTPQRVKEWEEAVGWTYRQLRGMMFHGSVQVVMRFYRKSRRRVDLSNLVKCVEDGLNGVAWGDDSQIKHLEAEVRQDGDNPRVEVEIEPWRAG